MNPITLAEIKGITVVQDSESANCPSRPAEALKFKNASPRNGGVNSGVTLEFWPGQPATVNGELYELQRAWRGILR